MGLCLSVSEECYTSFILGQGRRVAHQKHILYVFQNRQKRDVCLLLCVSVPGPHRPREGEKGFGHHQGTF